MNYEEIFYIVTSEMINLKKGELQMLILTRRAGEALMIGEDVCIKVLGVKGNQVRIGIDAPKDVAVHREEIFARIQDDGDYETE